MHTKRVVEMSLAVARGMQFNTQMLDHLRRGALLHDIGNMAIPDTILFKPAELSPGEWAIMRRHSLFAREMLYQVELLSFAMDIPLFHHERWDGSGYPYGMTGEMIPLAARVFAVVDVWDALTSDRPYRRAWSEQAAFAYISDNSGILFDPEVVRVFREIYNVILAIKRNPEAAIG
jgi:HD-GYP domain-containing protein (c-di-GMP phosphodiesterase class II)